jgi:hypothetical protein
MDPNYPRSAPTGAVRAPQPEAPAPGVSLNSSGNVSVNGSAVGGRDAYNTTNTVNDNRQRHVRIGLGLGGLALVALVGTGAAVYHHDRGVA